MSGPRCKSCGEPSPHGDERLVWLGWHAGWLHRLIWWLKGGPR